MNYTILDFLQLIGSLGVFLFGMKMMSEALQKVAGNKMRTILAAMTSNRVKGVITGCNHDHHPEFLSHHRNGCQFR